jgi:hypothetical protein
MAINLRDLERKNLDFKIISSFALNYDRQKAEEYCNDHLPSVYHIGTLEKSQRNYGNTLLIPVDPQASLLDLQKGACRTIRVGPWIFFPYADLLVEYENKIYQLRQKSGFLYISNGGKRLASIAFSKISKGHCVANCFPYF